MKTPNAVLLILGVLALTGSAPAQTNLTQDAPASGVNLAVVASPSSLSTSGDTTVDALNGGFFPKNSRDVSHRSHGNWPRTGAQWVQYDWSQPISTKPIEVYRWDDRCGVRLPKACWLKFRNGSDFVLVTGLGVAGNPFNIATFDEVQTSKLRLEMDSGRRFSTAMLEWRVDDSVKSPAVPSLLTT